jgi:exosome complex component RRP41
MQLTVIISFITARQCTEISHALRQTFEAAILTELYPLSKIDIFVQVLQSDGSNQSVCINAITMALIDAGIPMKDYVCSCTVSLINDAPLTDLNYLEEMAGFPELVLAILPKSCKIILLQISSRLHTDNLDSLMSAAMEGSKRVHTILDKIIKGHLQNSTISLAI